MRDRLLKHQINDIDIATPEKPETIKNIFEGENYKIEFVVESGKVSWLQGLLQRFSKIS